MSGAEVIRVRGLRKSYGERVAVDGVSFDVHAGEVFALLGPNGAGKTSTVEVLEGFRQRDGGEVAVLGRDPGTAAGRAVLRERVGMVFQESGHYRYLTVRETLSLHHGLYRSARPVDEVLELVGLEAAQGQQVRTLSGGQVRRLDVGVALLGRPELLFLDEPTTGFDPAARKRAWDLVGGLRDTGAAVVLTTHYMEEAQALADRVAVMRDGRIVGIGTPRELAGAAGLRTRITFALPPDVYVTGTPLDGLEPEGDGMYRLDVDDPVSTLAAICGWAQQRGYELAGLTVQAASLEDTYLALTDEARPAAGTDAVHEPEHA